MSATDTIQDTVQDLYDAGVHFGYSSDRRHPSAKPFIFATKEKSDILDLITTEKYLEAAKTFVGALASQGKAVLFVSGKQESLSVVKEAAEKVGAPFVAGRWIGGTLTNFKIIRKRIERYEKLTADRESGELEKKYTKKEQLLLSREIEGLEFRFGGIIKMADLPGAMFVVDGRHELTAVKEANQLGIPIVSLSSTDCDFARIQFPIPGNDTSVKSVSLVTHAIADAIAAGRRKA